MVSESKLKDITILIGKEFGPSRRLQIAVTGAGQTRVGFLGNSGSVPSSVSHCRPDSGQAHCKIAEDSGGRLLLTNLKDKNVTFVNDIEIVSKIINRKSNVTLGIDKYPLDIGKVLDLAERLISMSGASAITHKPVFSILPLKEVWETYENEDFNLKKRQKNLGIIRSLYMPCVILSSLLGFLTKYLGMDDVSSKVLSYILYAVAVVFLFYGLFKTITDKSLEEAKIIKEKFQSKYLCPNPDCRHFMGQQPYSILRQSHSCPYCKCRFIE